MSREGLAWARRSFDDATECHDIIEITDDPVECFSASLWERTDRGFRQLIRNEPEWADVEWDPDHPPERV
jgi:hypothetical protein